MRNPQKLASMITSECKLNRVRQDAKDVLKKITKEMTISVDLQDKELLADYNKHLEFLQEAIRIAIINETWK